MPRFHEVHLEVTTFCNFRCGFCPLTGKQRSPQHMPVEVACRIIDEIADGKLAPRLTYHLLGEPLLHPALSDILRHARSRRLANRVVTNGSLLGTRVHLAPLAYCDQLDISLRATNAAEFERVHAGGDFCTYLAGIAAVIEERERLGLRHIRVRMFAGPHVPRLARELGLGVARRDFAAVARGETVPVDRGLSLYVEPRLDWRGDRKRFPSRFFGRCDEAAKGFSVLVNGDVTLCCWDCDGRNRLGNVITDGGIARIVLGQAAASMREKLRRRQIPTPFCAGCLGRPSRLHSVVYQLGWAVLGLPQRLPGRIA